MIFDLSCKTLIEQSVILIEQSLRKITLRIDLEKLNLQFSCREHALKPLEESFLQIYCAWYRA